MAPRPLSLSRGAGVRRACAGACVLALLAGCGGDGGAKVPHGRLTGTVTRGPITPVCRSDTPCTAPASGLRLSFVCTNRIVAFPLLPKNGRYSVSLPAGACTVNFANRNRTAGAGRLTPSQVHVVAGRTRTVDFSIDTGIR